MSNHPLFNLDLNMKPGGSNVVADEMFPEGAGGQYMDMEEAGGSNIIDLTANEKSVHADFFNDFEDLFDDDDLS